MGRRDNTGPKKNNPARRLRDHHDVEQLTKFSINALPPEILSKIFGFLSSRERIKVERVCKHWKFWAQKSWQNIDNLTISSPRCCSHCNCCNTGSISFKLNNEVVFTLTPEEKQRVLRKVVSLCGRSVKQVALNGEVGRKTYSLIHNECSNLVALQLQNYNSYASVKILGPLFYKCTQLKYLSIDHCDLQMVSVLRQQPIEKLVYLTIGAMEADCAVPDIASVLEKLPRLTGFAFPTYPPLMRAVEMKINLNFPFSLHTNFSFDTFYEQECYQSIDLTNLTGACLYGLDIGDDFLVRLAVTCKNLKCLTVADNKRITERGLTAMSTLPKLTFLVISGVDAVTNEILSKFRQVGEIDCTKCETLTGNGYISLIKNSEKLEKLIISYKEKETEKFLKTAVEMTKSRASKKVLTIEVFLGPNDLVTKFGSKSKYLKICVERNCN